MPLSTLSRRFLALLVAVCGVAVLPSVARAQKAGAKPAAPPKPVRTAPVGFPQDAGPHDEASIEWWYFNSFLTTEKGKRYAVVGSFFRTGLSPRKKGHYLIYALADLNENKRYAYSVIDRTEVLLLRAVTEIAYFARQGDPKLQRLLALYQRGQVPRPHKALPNNAVLRTKPYFSLAFEGNTISQESADGRTWHVSLVGEGTGEEDWTLDLDLKQPDAPEGRPAMLVGGKGMTGVKRPDEMYYLTLSRMEATGTLTQDGIIESVKGTGWLDRQWGQPTFLQSYGWDWLSAQLDDGTDLLLFRIRNLATGDPVKTEATILRKDGTQTVERPTALKSLGAWTDPKTNITYPAGYEITLPVAGYVLSFTPAFPEQTIPVLGIGEAIWEGALSVKGMGREGPVSGNGYMELVGYKPGRKPPPLPKPAAPAEPASPAATP